MSATSLYPAQSMQRRKINNFTMGARGPKPTPTAILKGRGSWRGDINKSEPTPVLEMPDPPPFLDMAARAEWDRLAPAVFEMGCLTAVDGVEFGMYCCLLVKWQETRAFLKTNGETYVQRDKLGAIMKIVRFPQAETLRELQADIFRTGDRFGLNPAARTRLNVLPEHGSHMNGNQRQGEARKHKIQAREAILRV